MAYSNNQSSGGSSSRSGSTSLPIAIQTPQSNYELTLAQIAAQLGNKVFPWAQQTYGQTSALTNNQINQFNKIANGAYGQAGQIWNQYTGSFMPMNNLLVNEAGTYSSPSRVAFNMGAGESATSQAVTQGINNATQSLQSAGIDPSSGMYAELQDAQRGAGAAAAAGAGQQQQLATEATGRQLLGQAVSAGQQMPGQVVNALNEANAGTAGAENAGLANANTGVALQTAANPYLQTAMSMKYPPVGNVSNSSSGSVSQNSSYGQSSKPSQGGSGSGYGSRGGSPSAPTSPINPANISLPAGASSGYSSGSGASGGSNTWGGDAAWSGPPASASNGGSYDPYGSLVYTGAGGNYRGGGAVGHGAEHGMEHEGRHYSPMIGGIPDDRTTGGFVSKHLSPSGGHHTDDIPAHLNAEEFVVPKDVTKWLGQKFFQELIKKSRQARLGAPAHPSFGHAGGRR